MCVQFGWAKSEFPTTEGYHTQKMSDLFIGNDDSSYSFSPSE
jgi:hypothetical protein